MEKPKKLPDQPERSYELRDPKLPVIHGTAPHNLAQDHIHPRPTEQVIINDSLF